MRICDYLVERCILCEVKAKNKWEFFEEIAVCLAECLQLSAEKIRKVLEERERLSSTAIGEEIAIPHSRLAGLKQIAIAAGIKRQGLEFEALDKKPVKLIFVVLAPPEESTLYLKTLAQLARLLKRKDIRERLLEARTVEEFKKVLAEVDYEF
ncbi:MAG: PTS sugar transporter subunit IIA [Thermodesulfobacteria bacterium]|nr:PTS sugar transporter subunit IIA [Thermodesulfobacteriota bacterium]